MLRGLNFHTEDSGLPLGAGDTFEVTVGKRIWIRFIHSLTNPFNTCDLGSEPFVILWSHSHTCSPSVFSSLFRKLSLTP